MKIKPPSVFARIAQVHAHRGGSADGGPVHVWCGPGPPAGGRRILARPYPAREAVEPAWHPQHPRVCAGVTRKSIRNNKYLCQYSAVILVLFLRLRCTPASVSTVRMDVALFFCANT